MAGGSSDAAAALRLVSQVSRDRGPDDVPMRLGADVTVMLRGERALMTGAGEHVEPLPGEKPPLIVVPLDAALGAGEVYREFDAHDPPRTPEELDAAAEALRAGRLRARQRPRAAARAAVPADQRRARGAARGRRRAADGHRLRPDRVRHQRRPGGARPPAAHVPARRRA